MKKFFIIFVIFTSKLLAVNICGQDIRIGDKIFSINEDNFDIIIDSTTSDDFKIVATNISPTENEFSNVIIEASVISGTIYNILLYKKVRIGYTILGQEIDSIKSNFNNYIKKLTKNYGKNTFSTDSLLPFEDYRKIKVNSYVSFTKYLTKIYCSLQEKDNSLYFKVMYLNSKYEKTLKEESDFLKFMGKIENMVNEQNNI